MRSRRINKRVLFPELEYNNGGGLPSSGGIGPWPVTAVRTPASALELVQRPPLRYTERVRARSG
ncbi:hypothetical protein AVEN_223187-1, partial [Araneus ventricosus]